jgi:hypothetical protein
MLSLASDNAGEEFVLMRDTLSILEQILTPRLDYILNQTESKDKYKKWHNQIFDRLREKTQPDEFIPTQDFVEMEKLGPIKDLRTNKKFVADYVDWIINKNTTHRD